jgi:hypothetical protein
MTDLDRLLKRNDPARAHTDYTDQLISQMATAASSEVTAAKRRTPWWKTPRVVVPIAIGVGLMTTAGALIIPLVLGVNGQLVDIDARIPIQYTTKTGVTVACTYGIYVGDPAHRTTADQKLANYLNAQDWSGIGEKIYDRAMANPFIPGPNDDWEVDNQQLRDRFSFDRALNVIYERIPADLMTEGMSTGATTNCTGQLR